MASLMRRRGKEYSQITINRQVMDVLNLKHIFLLSEAFNDNIFILMAHPFYKGKILRAKKYQYPNIESVIDIF